MKRGALVFPSVNGPSRVIAGITSSDLDRYFSLGRILVGAAITVLVSSSIFAIGPCVKIGLLSPGTPQILETSDAETARRLHENLGIRELSVRLLPGGSAEIEVTFEDRSNGKLHQVTQRTTPEFDEVRVDPRGIYVDAVDSGVRLTLEFKGDRYEGFIDVNNAYARTPHQPVPISLRLPHSPATNGESNGVKRPPSAIGMMPETSATRYLVVAGDIGSPWQKDGFRSLLKAIPKSVKAIILTPDIDESWVGKEFASELASGRFVRILQPNIDSVWTRDYAPRSVLDANGKRRLVMFRYPKYQDEIRVQRANLQIAEALGVSLEQSPLIIQPGNLETDGRGTLVVTDQIYENNVGRMVPEIRSDGPLSEADVRQHLQQVLGARHVIVLPRIPGSSDVTGHVDQVAKYVGDNTFVVSSSTRPAAARALDRAATILGERYRVKRLAVAEASPESITRSYANATLLITPPGERVALVPQYASDRGPVASKQVRDADQAALDFYRGLGFQVEAVKGMEAFALEGGSVHCATANLY